MSQFQITLHRYAVQEATITIEPDPGTPPLDLAPSIDDPSLEWTTTSTIALSHDVMPIQPDEPDHDPEP